jgi:hypothetical protein
MSFPIVMIFERHWDTTPPLLIKNLLPSLEVEGYDTFCEEEPSSTSEADFFTKIKNRQQRDIKIMNVFNDLVDRKKIPFSKNLASFTCEELIEALPSSFPIKLIPLIKLLPATKLIIENLLFAKQRSFSIVFIDDPEFGKLYSPDDDDEARLKVLLKTKDQRDRVMADRLYDLYANHKGIIVSLGVRHSKAIVENLKRKGLTDKDIVCYFPHSSYSYNADEIKLSGDMATTIEEIDLLRQKILTEVKSKVIKNCHIEFLSEYFKVSFIPSLRTGYRLDARLPIEQVNDSIRQDLDDLGIKHHNNPHYFVIPDVNTTEIAHRIRLLPYKV